MCVGYVLGHSFQQGFTPQLEVALARARRLDRCRRGVGTGPFVYLGTFLITPFFIAAGFNS